MDRRSGRDQRPRGTDVPRDDWVNVAADTVDEIVQRSAEREKVAIGLPQLIGRLGTSMLKEFPEVIGVFIRAL